MLTGIDDDYTDDSDNDNETSDDDSHDSIQLPPVETMEVTLHRGPHTKRHTIDVSVDSDMSFIASQFVIHLHLPHGGFAIHYIRFNPMGESDGWRVVPPNSTLRSLGAVGRSNYELIAMPFTLGGMQAPQAMTDDDNDPNLSLSFATPTATPIAPSSSPMSMIQDQVAEQATATAGLQVDVKQIQSEFAQFKQGVTKDVLQIMQATNNISDSVSMLASTQQQQFDQLSDRIGQQSIVLSGLSSKTSKHSSDPLSAKRKSIAHVSDLSSAQQESQRLSQQFFKTGPVVSSAPAAPTPAISPSVSQRALAVKNSAANWYKSLTSADRLRIRRTILQAKSISTSLIDVSSGELPQCLVDAVIEDLGYTTPDAWDARINYFAIESKYMEQDIAKSSNSSSLSTSKFSSNPVGGGVVVMQRQSDSIPPELLLNKNVVNITCTGSVLYWLIIFRRQYLQWLSNPGNTEDSIRLVYAVSKKILASVLAALCNKEILDSGGYSSDNVAQIPNDVFLRMLFRLTRPTSVHEFLTVLSEAARFPAYPKDTPPSEITTANLNILIELSLVYCDKMKVTYEVLVTDIHSVNVLPSMYNPDELFRGLKGLFTSSFKPSYYIINLLSSLTQEQKDLLKSDITFQQYIDIVKELLVQQHETWLRTFKDIGTMLKPRKAPDLGEITSYSAQRLNAIQDITGYDEDDYGMPDSSSSNDFATDEEYFEDLSAFQQPSNQPMRPPPIGKQFDPKALYQAPSNYGRPKSLPPANASKPATAPGPMVCFQILSKGECKVPACKYSHDEAVVIAAHKRYGENIKKFVDTLKRKFLDAPAKRDPNSSNLHVMDETRPSDEEQFAELGAIMQLQLHEDVSSQLEVESFNAIKEQQAPTAASKNFSAVHVDGTVTVKSSNGRQRSADSN